MDLNERVTIITGAASGIGAACARAFAAKGARVAAVDRDAEGAEATAREVGGIAVECDVREEDAVDGMVAQVVDRLGPVDVLFNNAGLAAGRDVLHDDLALWDLQWQVNVMAHVYAIRAVLPSMLERGDGYIIHTASMAGILTIPGNVHYSVTKHALVGLAEWMSVSYHDRGVRTSLLAPLGVRTPGFGDTTTTFASTMAGPMKDADEVAGYVVDAVEEERFLILTDPVAQTWMDRKASDLDRWLRGMRRLQAKLVDSPATGVTEG